MSLNLYLNLLLKSVLIATTVAIFANASPASLKSRQASIAPPLPGGWLPVGCYSDVSSSRTLKTASFTNVTGMTLEACAAFCTIPLGYKYSGVEYARECYCDNVIESSGTPIAVSSCNMPCTGNVNEICGGAGAINIMENIIPQWLGVDCYTDDPSNRTLQGSSYTDATGMSVGSCLAFCTLAAYKYAGLENGQECYCGNDLHLSNIPGAMCNKWCTGDPPNLCGGPGGLDVYKYTATTTTTTTSTASSTTSTSTTPTATPTIKQSVGSFQYQGCYQDGVGGIPRSLVHQITISGGATAETCIAACKAGGFILAGLEYGGECWCAIYMPYATHSPDTDCNMVCKADNTELCGAGNRLAIYVDSSAPPLNLQTCLIGQQLQQSGNNPQFEFNVEGQYAPAFPGAPVSANTLLGNIPVPIRPDGFHLEVLTGRVLYFPHRYTLRVDTVGTPAALIVVDFGVSLQPIAGDNFFFDAGTVPPLTPFYGVCAQPNPFTVSTYIGPPVLAINQQAQVWSFCTGGTGPSGLVYLKNTTSGSCSDIVLAMAPALG